MSEACTNVLLAVQKRWLSGWTIDTNSPEEYGRLMAIQLAAVERGFKSALVDPLDLAVTLRVPVPGTPTQTTPASHEEIR